MKNRDLKDQFKSEFDKLEFSRDEASEIRDKVIKKYHHDRRRNKIILCISSLMLLCLTGVGIVYAEEISDLVRGFKLTTYTKENGSTDTVGESSIIKEMNYDADIPELDDDSKGKDYSLRELESKLGMKVLKNDYFEEKAFNQRKVKRIDGKIASASFRCGGSFKEKYYDKFYIQWFMFYFNTKYQKDGGKVYWTSGSGFEPIEYYIKSLNTTAYILTWKETDEMSQVMVNFIYDNVGYDMFLHFIPKVQREDGVKAIGEMLESLHY